MLKPLGNSVLLRKIDADKTTPGGLIVPETAKDQGSILRGVVVAVGRGRYLDRALELEHPEDPSVITSLDFLRPEVEVGHTVIAWKARGFEIEHNGEKLFAINADDVIAIET